MCIVVVGFATLAIFMVGRFDWLKDIFFTRSQVVVVNMSGQRVQNVTVSIAEYNAVIAEVPAGARYVLRPVIQGSTLLRLKFEYAGREVTVSDCGCISPRGETRKVTILPGGMRAEINFGSVTNILVVCKQKE